MAPQLFENAKWLEGDPFIAQSRCLLPHQGNCDRKIAIRIETPGVFQSLGALIRGARIQLIVWSKVWVDVDRKDPTLTSPTDFVALVREKNTLFVPSRPKICYFQGEFSNTKSNAVKAPNFLMVSSKKLCTIAPGVFTKGEPERI